MHALQAYGWNNERTSAWKQRDDDGAIPARVVADFGHIYQVVTPERLSARISGTLAHKSKTVDMPKVGDWVAVTINSDGSAIIQSVLPRSTEIVRGQAGRLLDKQVVAANVDVALVMQSLNDDFSVERLERYIFQLAKQHIETKIILNKADVAINLADKQALLANLGVESFVVSAKQDDAITEIEQLIIPGQTAVIMGSSGVGKSTLTNRLLKEQRQATGATRERDSSGRHTTVHRELFILPGGGMIIDTPGIRELQLWGDVSELDNSFPDIATARSHCRYKNCSHSSEDGCAIRVGLAVGSIDAKRYKTYLGFKRELEALESKRKYIDERRSQQTKESAKRRHRRAIFKLQSDDID
jgi:ribosome biogenesis GTPase